MFALYVTVILTGAIKQLNGMLCWADEKLHSGAIYLPPSAQDARNTSFHRVWYIAELKDNFQVLLEVPKGLVYIYLLDMFDILSHQFDTLISEAHQRAVKDFIDESCSPSLNSSFYKWFNSRFVP